MLSGKNHSRHHPTANSSHNSVCAFISILPRTAWVSRQQELLNSVILSVRHKHVPISVEAKTEWVIQLVGC